MSSAAPDFGAEISVHAGPSAVRERTRNGAGRVRIAPGTPLEYKLHDAGAWEKESKTGSGNTGSAATFVVVTVAEVLLAVAIIMGIWVRMSALILSLGILLMLAWGGFGAGELEFVWLGVYVFLIISGGGLYAFDTALTPAKPKK